VTISKQYKYDVKFVFVEVLT